VPNLSALCLYARGWAGLLQGSSAMAVLAFTLSEDGITAFRDALICLNKFSDDVSLEARKDSVGPQITSAYQVTHRAHC